MLRGRINMSDSVCRYLHIYAISAILEYFKRVEMQIELIEFIM